VISLFFAFISPALQFGEWSTASGRSPETLSKAVYKAMDDRIASLLQASDFFVAPSLEAFSKGRMKRAKREALLVLKTAAKLLTEEQTHQLQHTTHILLLRTVGRVISPLSWVAATELQPFMHIIAALPDKLLPILEVSTTQDAISFKHSVQRGLGGIFFNSQAYRGQASAHLQVGRHHCCR
jgi:hypothetical protein